MSALAIYRELRRLFASGGQLKGVEYPVSPFFVNLPA
jgi:hypothetical protein